MAERRPYFMEHLDDLRTLLMYEPRGHSAMSGAILQPPTRPDADCGRALHRGLRLPADVRARHHRRRHGAGRDRHGRRSPSRSRTIRLDTPAGLVVAEVAVEDGAPTRSRSATCRRSPSRLDADRRRPGLGAGPLRPGLRRQLLRDRRSRRSSGCRSTGPQQGRILDAGLAIMDAINAHRPARAPRATRRSAAATTCTSLAPGLGRPSTRGTRWRSTRAGSTARRAAPAPAPRMAQLHARGRAAAGHRLRQRVVHRHPVHRPAGRGDDGRRDAGGRSRRSPAAPGSPAPPVLARPDDPFPEGFQL